MIRHRLDLILLGARFAVCRLDAADPIPPWAVRGDFCSITRTADELSVVCPEAAVPDGVQAERGWRVLRVVGTLDFTLVGILTSLTGPLAQAGISLCAISTFGTDYLLLREPDLGRATEALVAAGHAVSGRESG